MIVVDGRVRGQIEGGKRAAERLRKGVLLKPERMNEYTSN